ncbi:hypothetical protein FQN53_000512 [Emmonsiellopsis sp. PD_33]|nr:hypothetical protein FQN53_000512 [Emmonsiellopsis sp. PD_33]KAK2792982.1 hypothetical protein FQN51_001387 [Onygenales sp. PD_10]
MGSEHTPLLPQNVSHIPGPRAVPSSGKWNRILFAGVTGLFISTILFLRSQRASVPDSIDHEFGVGFDLTSPYGTAAISYTNGTVVNVAKIDASSAYQEAMARLSLRSSAHLHPPYNALNDYFRDQPRQLLRKARKAAGLPASSDVGELAQLVLSLRSATETHLSGTKISGAVATIPHLPALYQEDLEDAFEYAGLIYIPHQPYWNGGLLSETAAVYAGNGFGMCSNYTDDELCQDEKRNPPYQAVNENVLSISYTRNALISTWATEGMGFAFPAADRFQEGDFKLGSARRYDNPKEEYYWAAVRDVISRPVFMANDNIDRETHRVLLHGEDALDERFRDVLSDVLQDVLPNNPPVFEMDTLYAAARGASEMAKRVGWRFKRGMSPEGLEVVE